MDPIKKLAHDFQQNELAEPIIQRMIIIQGDIAMNRNHAENLKYLSDMRYELNQRIDSDTKLGKKTLGFEKMNTEIGEWIKIILPLAAAAGSENGD